MLHVARCKYRTQKIAISAPSLNFVGPYPHNMANVGPLTAEISLPVWGTTAHFNGFHVLAALLHGTLVMGVSQTAVLNRGCHLVGRAAIALGIGPHSSCYVIYKKVKSTIPHEECWWGAHLPYLGLEPIGG